MANNRANGVLGRNSAMEKDIRQGLSSEVILKLIHGIDSSYQQKHCYR